MWGSENPWEDQRLTYDVDEVLAPLSNTTATGDPNSAIVLEVARVADDIVMDSAVRHVGEKFKFKGHVLAKVGRKVANVTLPPGATATLFRHGRSESTSGRVVLELGERLAIEYEGKTWRLRVDRAAREAGKSTGVKKALETLRYLRGAGVRRTPDLFPRHYVDKFGCATHG